MGEELKQKLRKQYYWVTVGYVILFFFITVLFGVGGVLMINGTIEMMLVPFCFDLVIFLFVAAGMILYMMRLFKDPFNKLYIDIKEYQIQRYYSFDQLFYLMVRGNQIHKNVWMTQDFLFFLYYGELRVIPYIMIKKMDIRYRNKSFWVYQLGIYKKEKQFCGLPILSGSKKKCEKCLMMIDEQKRRCKEGQQRI